MSSRVLTFCCTLYARPFLLPVDLLLDAAAPEAGLFVTLPCHENRNAAHEFPISYFQLFESDAVSRFAVFDSS